jgi:hypothetical protein
VSTQVVVKVHEPGADTERLSTLATTLRIELLTLEVEYVNQVRGAAAPRGAKGIDAVDAGVLLTSLTASAEIGRHLIATVQAWLRRGSSAVPRSVELTIGDRTVTVTGAAREQQDELVAAFLSSVKQP